MYSCHSILKCYNLFSGVKLSISVLLYFLPSDELDNQSGHRYQNKEAFEPIESKNSVSQKVIDKTPQF